MGMSTLTVGSMLGGRNVVSPTLWGDLALKTSKSLIKHYNSISLGKSLMTNMGDWCFFMTIFTLLDTKRATIVFYNPFGPPSGNPFTTYKIKSVRWSIKGPILFFG